MTPPDTPQEGGEQRRPKDPVEMFAQHLEAIDGPEEEEETQDPGQGLDPDPESDEDYEEFDDEFEEDLEDEDTFDDEFEDDEEEPEQDDSDLHTVKVQGEELQVPLEELKAGYSRQADYTRKTQALAEQAQALQQEAQQVQGERQQYAALLTQLRDSLVNIQESQEPDWERLKQEDPVGFSLKREEWRERKEQIDAAEQELAEVQQRQQAELQQRLQQVKQKEAQALLEALPEWKDPDKRRAQQSKLYQYATEVRGFSADELNQVFDHRLILLLRDAQRFHELRNDKQTLRKSRRKSKTKTASPGSQQKKRTPRSKKKQKAARRRLKETGSVDAAAQVFDSMI